MAFSRHSCSVTFDAASKAQVRQSPSATLAPAGCAGQLLRPVPSPYQYWPKGTTAPRIADLWQSHLSGMQQGHQEVRDPKGPDCHVTGCHKHRELHMALCLTQLLQALLLLLPPLADALGFLGQPVSLGYGCVGIRGAVGLLQDMSTSPSAPVFPKAQPSHLQGLAAVRTPHSQHRQAKIGGRKGDTLGHVEQCSQSAAQAAVPASGPVT